jgi:hypothetical protein
MEGVRGLGGEAEVPAKTRDRGACGARCAWRGWARGYLGAVGSGWLW